MVEEYHLEDKAMPTGFLEKLRMNNIYGNMGSPDRTIAPKFSVSAGLDPMDEVLNRYSTMRAAEESAIPFRPHLEQIAEGVSGKSTTMPVQLGYEPLTEYQSGLLDIRRQELGQRGQIESGRQDIQRERAGISQQRADVYEFKARNPNVRIIEQRGGNTIAVNPTTGEIIKDFGPSGFLSEQERLDLQQEGAMERIGRTGQEQRETALIRGDIEQQQIGQRGEEARKTRATAPGVGVRPELPTQTTARIQNTINRILAQHPEWAQYIDRNTGRIAPVGTGIGARNLTEALRNQIVEAIYGTPGVTEAEAPITPTTKTPPKAPEGWQYVPKAGGGWTAIPTRKQ